MGNDKIGKALENKDNIEIALKYLNDNINNIHSVFGKEYFLQSYFNFDEPSKFNEFTHRLEALQILSDLEIISFEKLEIKKSTKNFSFEDASSGEYHIILTYLNVLSLIEDNSLVMLDEPEISLHPNWQIKYMNIFSNIFSRFPNSHFIIVSHSHFLVSDLKSENSNILAIDFNSQKQIEVSQITKSTYGWSAEQILLDIFKVATTRNYYLTRIVGNILHNLSLKEFDKSKIVDDIKILNDLDLDNLNDNDPMKIVIKKLLKKIG